MKAAFSQRFTRQYKALSAERKAKFDKQLGLLLSNLRHPSLPAKKYDEARDVWQARVDEDYRFYFTIQGDTSSSRLEDRVRIGLSRGSGAVPGQTIRGERAGGALVARRFPR